VGELTCSSTRVGGVIQTTAKGSYTFQNVAYQVDLTANIDHFFESSFGGSHTITDSRLSGTITAAQFLLAVSERVRFEIVVQSGQTASSTEDWIAHKLTLGTDTFDWVDVKKQKSFREGLPSRVDEYWQAQGAIRKNQAPFGTYKKVSQIVSGLGVQVKFVVELPNETIELESWNVFPR